MRNFFMAVVLVPFVMGVGVAQDEMHSDIEFGFDPDGSGDIVVESEIFANGFQVIEAEFEGLGGTVFAENPGFVTAADEGLTVNAGDAVNIKFLNAQTMTPVGTGYVTFYDPVTDQLVPDTGEITIRNQMMDTAELDGESIGAIDSLLLSVGSDGKTMANSPDGDTGILPPGEIHNHLVFTLGGSLDDGAYGILFQFEVDIADEDGNLDGTIDATSAPVWLLFNNGMDEEDFEEIALPAFGAVEPVLLGDVNMDESVDFQDISPFITLLTMSIFQAEADINEDLAVNFADIAGFIQILSGSSGK